MRSRRLPDPPPGLTDHVSRREAARLLGFASDFPIRQLERAGTLRGVRGVMGQAWYPRAAVLDLLPASHAAPRPHSSDLPNDHVRADRRDWTDAELIGLLRETVAAGRPRTVVDLVADTGIPIARATRLHKFWLTNDRHPTAELARRSVGVRGAVDAEPLPARAPVAEPVAQPATATPVSRERRGSDRTEREGLIRKLRDPDPAVRALAFEKLRPGRKS